MTLFTPRRVLRRRLSTTLGWVTSGPGNSAESRCLPVGWGPTAAPMTNPVGDERRPGLRRADRCDHYAFRQGNYDWQLDPTGSKPLPRRS